MQMKFKTAYTSSLRVEDDVILYSDVKERGGTESLQMIGGL